MTAIVVNNSTYGMTGGQSSPTTPLAAKTATAKAGHVERPFDIAALSAASGATFVARTTCFHARHAEEMMKKGISHGGFSVVEMISGCHTNYGRRNEMPDPAMFLKDQKERAVLVGKASGMSESDLAGKYLIGVLSEGEEAEWTKAYADARRAYET